MLLSMPGPIDRRSDERTATGLAVLSALPANYPSGIMRKWTHWIQCAVINVVNPTNLRPAGWTPGVHRWQWSSSTLTGCMRMSPAWLLRGADTRDAVSGPGWLLCPPLRHPASSRIRSVLVHWGGSIYTRPDWQSQVRL